MKTEPSTTPPLLIISGLSGSGKSVVLRTLEDLDYYCVDNLPAELLPEFVASVAADKDGPQRLAVGIDVRNRPEGLTRLPHSLAEVGRMGCQHQLVFLDTLDEVLLRRYSETRRRHPLSGDGLPLADAIALERQRLRPLAAIADRVVDSSAMNVHQLRRWVVTELAANAQPGLSLLVQSFAYRRGVPADADFVFDVRCLPNPHYDPVLRPLTGRDRQVIAFMEEVPDACSMLEDITRYVERWLPCFVRDNRSYLTVAIGCTGGRHRSVYFVETMARHFRSTLPVLVRHRELRA